MSSSTLSPRKRDRVARFFKGQNSRFKAETVAQEPVASTTLKVKDSFLEEALKLLPESERLHIQSHVALDVHSTIQAVYKAAETQKNVCEQKRWSGRDTVDKVLVWLDRFRSVGDIVANIDPVHVGLPWAGIRIILETAVADNRQMLVLTTGMDLALYLANRLQVYSEYYHRLPSSIATANFRKALIALYAHILGFFAKALHLYSMSDTARKIQALWRIPDIIAFEQEGDKLGTRANVEADNCDRELNFKAGVAANKWRNDLQNALQHLQSETKASLDVLHINLDLSKLVKVGEATYNSRLEAKLSRCLQGTRLDILHNITQWADDADGKPLFWLCGQAGTGKSTISRTVAHHFAEQGRLGATFFFKRNERKRSNADHFFSTITVQLADVIPQLRGPVAAALDRDSLLCDRGITEQFDNLILEPLLTIDSLQLLRRELVIVIDALDECDRDTDIRLFLRLLSQISVKSALQLRIFLTSRPELPIRLGFRQLNGDLHHDVVLEEVQEPTIRDDICNYFDHEFAKIRDEQLLRQPNDLLPSDWPDQQTRQALVSLAVPLFIFAATVCLFISQSSPQKRLDTILQQGYSAGSSQLSRLYVPILDELLVDKEEQERQELLIGFRKVVGSIVLAIDPLSVSSLAALLDLRPPEIQNTLEQLHSVLHVPHALNDPVRLLHLSFRDFLVDLRRRDGSEFWISEAETHKRLALGCLRRLADPKVLKMDICCITQPGTRRAQVSRQHIENHITPDVAYACSYWPLHYLESGEALLDESPVYGFVQHYFVQWLEASSWLDNLSTAITFIHKLSSLAQKCNTNSKISSFLKDAQRFVLRHRYIIELAPLQIYHSAMIFSPTQSIIRQTCYEDIPQLWSSVPEVPEQWGAEILALEYGYFLTDVCFSRDGSIFAASFTDGTVRLWKSDTGEQIRMLRHDGQLSAISISPDCTFVVTSSSAYAAEDGAMVLNRGSHDDKPDSEMIVVPSIRFWSVETGEQIEILHGLPDWAQTITFSPDGSIIALRCEGAIVRLWSLQTGEQIEVLQVHPDPVAITTFSPDGSIIAFGYKGAIIRLWSLQTGEQIHALQGHTKGITCLAFSPNERILASGSLDQTVRLWNLETGEQIQMFEGPKAAVFKVNFSPTGLVVVSTADDMLIIYVWDAVTNPVVRKLEGQGDKFERLALSDNGTVIVTAEGDGLIRLWDVITGKQIQILRGHVMTVDSIAISSDGSSILSTAGDCTLRLWSTVTESDEEAQEYEGPDGFMDWLAFSSDGEEVASRAIFDGEVRLWNAVTGKEKQRLGTFESINRIEFYPDGTPVAIVWSTSGLQLLHAITREKLRDLEGDGWSPNATVFTPDGLMVASYMTGRSIRLWSFATGEQIRVLHLHSKSRGALSFSRDGKALACSTFVTTQVLDTSTGESLQVIENITGEEISFCTNGKGIRTRNHTILLNKTVRDVLGPPPTSLDYGYLWCEWISSHGEEYLYLPPEYRGWKWTFHEAKMAIGTRLGSVGVYALKADHDALASRSR